MYVYYVYEITFIFSYISLNDIHHIFIYTHYPLVI
jgi:hypothetical protein